MFIALCLYRDQLAHIKPVELALKDKVEFIYDTTWDEDIIEKIKPDIVIGINEFHVEIAKCYEKAQALNIPTLTLQDGILEWRFMFQNEMYEGNKFGVPMHHPILADKYACLGFALANQIAALGNEHKVEVIGMPKLDFIAPVELMPKSKEEINVLIITAAKPWFDESQKKVVISMLTDLKFFFSENKGYKVTWRITKLLDKELGVNTSFGEKASLEIVAQIKESDLVISTTSTAIIEAMRLGKPVAKIDYFNLPQMLTTTWNINHASQIGATIESMAQRNLQMCWHQNYLLNLQCINDSKASERISKLILEMIAFKKSYPNKNLPSNITNHSNTQIQFSFPNVKDFYPKREVLQKTEIDWLRDKLVRYELKNTQLNQQLEKRSFGKMLLSGYSKFLKKARAK